MLFQELLLSYDSLKGLIFVWFVNFFYGKDITSSAVPPFAMSALPVSRRFLLLVSFLYRWQSYRRSSLSYSGCFPPAAFHHIKIRHPFFKRCLIDLTFHVILYITWLVGFKQTVVGTSGQKPAMQHHEVLSHTHMKNTFPGMLFSGSYHQHTQDIKHSDAFLLQAYESD
mgnify:CR=1 FL=1